MPSTQDAPHPRLLLADDHADTAELLRRLLQPHYEVIAVVADGRALVKAAAELSPDVIVADISMPHMDGIDATAAIRRHSPGACVVLVTVHTGHLLVERGLAAGASAYVLKDSAGEELVEAVRAVLAGRLYISRVLREGASDLAHDRADRGPE